MKISGRNIKRRLYSLINIPSDIKRARYFRGHGVHSPFVYNVVRQVFMCRELKCDNHDLYDALIQQNIPQKRCIQLQNLISHCNYSSWSIDCPTADVANYDMVRATINTTPATLQAMTDVAIHNGTTLCIIAPAYDRERHAVCKALVDRHTCTSVDNRGYLLLFNNHLPKQKFRL